jgi:hypothetical protein
MTLVNKGSYSGVRRYETRHLFSSPKTDSGRARLVCGKKKPHTANAWAKNNSTQTTSFRPRSYQRINSSELKVSVYYQTFRIWPTCGMMHGNGAFYFHHDLSLGVSVQQ